MELPTYTNIWRIEKRLYKLYDFRLPMPLPVGQIAVFAAIAVPYVVALKLIGLPFSHTLLWLYILPPGALAWLITRPVLEGKRLPELVVSQLRYLSEPRTWCRMAPLAEKEEITVVARVWRRADVEVVGVEVVGVEAAGVEAAAVAGADVAAVVGTETAQVVGTELAEVVGGQVLESASAGAFDAVVVGVEAPGIETAGAEVGAARLDEAETAGTGMTAASRSGMAAPAEAPPPPVEYRPARSALTRHLPTGPVPAWPKAPARADRTPASPARTDRTPESPARADSTPASPASAPPARGVPAQAARAVPTPSVWQGPALPARAVPGRSARETPARPARTAPTPPSIPAPPAREVREQPAPATPAPPVSAPAVSTPPPPSVPRPPVPAPPVRTPPSAPAPPAREAAPPAREAAPPAREATPPAREATAPAARAVPAPSAPPAPPPRSRPVVTVTGNQQAERPIRMVERALGHPAERRLPGWRDHVVVVPGGHRPGQPDQMQRDRARARLPLPGGHRIVVLGCTVGAGQTTTALLTGEVLASLRDDQVAALDLNPGPGSLADRARAVPALTEPQPPAPSQLEVVTRDTAAAPDAGTPGAPRPGEDLQDVTKIFELLSARYPLTLADPGAAVVPRVLAAASQLILVSPASQDAASALATTREWLEAHGHAGLAEEAIIVLNGVSRHTMPYVEQAEALARGRCRAIVRVPWDDHLKRQEPQRAAASPPGAHPAELAEPLNPAALQAYTAMAGVLVAALASAPGQLRARS